MTQLYLKPGRQKSVKHKHPWVFSGAIERIEGEPASGDEVRVLDAAGQFLARGFYSQHHSIRCRLLRWEDEPIDAAFLQQRIRSAIRLRRRWITGDTDAYRLVNGEGDGLPGLIVDQYGDILVMQISHAGMDRRRDEILQTLEEELDPLAIYEKSDVPSRKAEGLPASVGTRLGDFNSGAVRITENGLIFYVDIVGGQKTGFYLDQRDNRHTIRQLARGRRVLNCFAYTGGFTVAAMAGGAETVVSVDSSKQALELAQKNVRENGFQLSAEHFVAADVGDYLRTVTDAFDIVILDPPAFARHRQDVNRASRAYKDINLQAMKRLPSGGLLFTCSCSQHISPDLFQKILFAAAHDAKRSVRVLSEHAHPVDHPFSLYHPEGRYLHAFLLEIE